MDALELAVALARACKVRFGVIEVRVTGDSLTVVRATHTLTTDDLRNLTTEFPGPPSAPRGEPEGA